MNNKKLLELISNEGKIRHPLGHRNPGTLSICMIVKNEEANLKTAMDSASACADEIIVVDTGSTDNTVKIAKGYDKARVFLASWDNDFAAARNIGLEKAACAWILWLDADDIIPPASAEKLNRLKLAPLDRCFSFRITNTLNLLPLGSSWIQLRMFPNTPEIRFEGPIHEQCVHGCLRLGLHRLAIDLDLYHTGYDNPETKQAKAMRNLPIYDKVPMEDRGYFWYTSRGDTLYNLKLWDEGIAQFIIASQTPDLDRLNRDAAIDIPEKIGYGLEHQKKYEEAIAWYDKVIDRNIMALYQKAICLHQLKRPLESLKVFMDVINFKSGPEMSLPNNANNCKMYAYHHALRLNLGLGKPIEAGKIVEAAHKTYPEAWFLDER